MAFEAANPHNEWEEFLRGHPETAFIDTFMVGISGQLYGKREPVADIKRILNSGVTFSACAAVLDVHGHGTNALGIGGSDGDPDAVGCVIPGTFAPVPWAKSPTAQCLLDMRHAETGDQLWFDPRKVLADVVKRLNANGLYPTVACELEFYLIDSERTEDGKIRPAKLSRTNGPPRAPANLSVEQLEDYSDFILAIDTAARAQGIPASTAVAEYGLGQFEINLKHVADPLLAADHATLLKRVIRGVARERGDDVTFMAKPYMDQPGSGMHVHVSLMDKDGKNIFSAANGTDTLRSAVAGLQSTLSEALGIFAANFSAFRRFKPDNLVPVNGHWGHNNRSVAFRVPFGEGQSRRIEHRVAGADASPHLALAAILAGIDHGVMNKLVPTQPIDGKNADSIPVPTKTAKMAPHFLASLDALAQAKILKSYFPPDFPKLYREIKLGEFTELFSEPLSREFDYYL